MAVDAVLVGPFTSFFDPGLLDADLFVPDERVPGWCDLGV